MKQSLSHHNFTKPPRLRFSTRPGTSNEKQWRTKTAASRLTTPGKAEVRSHDHNSAQHNVLQPKFNAGELPLTFKASLHGGEVECFWALLYFAACKCLGRFRALASHRREMLGLTANAISAITGSYVTSTPVDVLHFLHSSSIIQHLSQLYCLQFPSSVVP